jgi:hypothetical protein
LRHRIWYSFDKYFTYFVPVFKYCYSDSRNLWTVNQILRRQTSRSHYSSKVPAVTVTVFKYRNKIGKIFVKAVPYSVTQMSKIALKSDSTHHFFRNACTKSGSLRFSQFSGCWLILSVHIIMSLDFPFVRLFGVR